jgi:Tfp pilus assembly protein PilF
MPPSAARPLPRSRVDTPAQAARLISEADELWKRGELATARERYREAGGVRDATGESAWLALARRELSRGDTAAAHAALREHDRRFQNGSLTGESLGIAFRVAQTEHDVDGARRIALQLVSHYAHTAQGKAAQRWLDETH